MGVSLLYGEPYLMKLNWAKSGCIGSNVHIMFGDLLVVKRVDQPVTTLVVLLDPVSYGQL